MRTTTKTTTERATIQTSIRLTVDTMDKLETLAEAQGKTKTAMITQLIEQHPAPVGSV